MGILAIVIGTLLVVGSVSWIVRGMLRIALWVILGGFLVVYLAQPVTVPPRVRAHHAVQRVAHTGHQALTQGRRWTQSPGVQARWHVLWDTLRRKW